MNGDGCCCWQGQLDVFTDISGPLGNITQLNTGRNVDNLTPENGAFEDGGLTVELQTVRQVLDTVSVDLFTIAIAIHIILLHL